MIGPLPATAWRRLAQAGWLLSLGCLLAAGALVFQAWLAADLPFVWLDQASFCG